MTPQKSRDEAPPLRTPRRHTPLLPNECLLVNIEGNIGIGKRRGVFLSIGWAARFPDCGDGVSGS